MLRGSPNRMVRPVWVSTLATIIVLVLIMGVRGGRSDAPASLGQPFVPDR